MVEVIPGLPPGKALVGAGATGIIDAGVIADGVIAIGDLAAAPLAWKIGQMLAIGFPSGEEGFSVLGRTLRKTLAGNLILFARNGYSAETAADSASRGRRLVLEATGLEPLVAIDQEGGAVARIRKGLTPIPGAMAQSAAFLGGAVTLADIEALGEVCGSELRELGIDWDLAPVADVNVNPANPVIGVRSFGENPHVVAAMASAFARGLARGGVVATAKHFPGHGDTAVDSHLDLPLVPHGFPRLDEVELLPFKRLIAEGIPAIMTSHVRFPAVEPDPLPATLSSRVLTDLLRKKLGFKGLICSDCMEMKAVADRYGDRFAMAVMAGVDLLFVSHTAEIQERAASSIAQAVEEGRIPMSRIDESVKRIMRLKNLYDVRSEASRGKAPAPSAETLALSARTATGSLTVLSPGTLREEQARQLPALALCLLVDVGSSASSAAEDGSVGPSLAESLVQCQALNHVADGSRARVLRLSMDPGAEEIDATVRLLNKAVNGWEKSGNREFPRVALALSAPFLRAGQHLLLKKALEFSAQNDESLIVVLTRSPYDLKGVLDLAAERRAPRPLVLCSYEYTESSVVALAAYLSGQSPALGKCPVHLLA